MAAIPYESILTSDFFRFLVGPERKQFFMHSSAVACQSQALEKLVNGDMREACERCAIWCEVEPDTFIRFSQYAYTGDYRAAQPHTREGMGLKQCFPPPSPSPPPKSKKIRKVKTFSSGGNMAVPTKDKDLWSQFKRLYPEPAPDHEAEDNTPEDDFSEVFLSHARLYVVADCYGISALKVLCLRKLHQALERFTVYEEAIGDIAQLVSFCYEHTVEPDDLRELVNMYTACKVVDLWCSREFQCLTMETAEYAGGLISEMLKRVD
ncbi:hypothetical protein BHE90_010070 [Fusarium euwallaceae]|uniref:BTB domain-containing protein n=1 Tax=Fusarium euwallaceae TaxID=1147111 RepID=A0A430LID4_9HYPO|nr:hypothetical protein BHE90_010070 [Fusarium euwallaceae]